MRVLGLFFFMALGAAGCQPSADAILIDALTQNADVERLQVTVFRSDDTTPISTSDRSLRRAASSITASSPIRVAIELAGPGPVVVHMLATRSDGERMIAIRCYDVRGVMRDAVMLVAFRTSADVDRDGFPRPTDADALCLDPAPSGTRPCDFRCPSTVGADCADCAGVGCAAADSNADTFPGAAERCEDGIDQNCDGRDDACGDNDGDGFAACGATRTPNCDCNDRVARIHPGAEEVCGDGTDLDCDGALPACDRDGDGVPADLPIGGRPDCDDTTSAISPLAAEVCTTGGAQRRDENCNGLVDELADCTPDDVDLDGEDGCRAGTRAGCDCNDCDPSIGTRKTEICGNGIDENCDGADQPCLAGDLDNDGQTSESVGGTDCDDSNARIYRDAPERCGDGVDQDCNGISESCDGDRDRDGWLEPPGCDASAAIHPTAEEVCDGVDNDCDGTADETNGSRIYGCASVSTDGTPCAGTERCRIDYATSYPNCGACGASCTATVSNACADGRCVCTGQMPLAACTGAQTCCAGSGCRDLSTDIENCGGCGRSCGHQPTVDRCTNSACSCGMNGPCEAGQICCDGTCVDLRSTQAHCGQCGNACSLANADSTCSDGVCAISRCQDGFADCNGSPGDGCEINLRANPAHCGRCGRVCVSPAIECRSGMCRAACSGSLQDCTGSGCTIDINTHPNHCGGCDNVCPMLPNANTTCAGGTCRHSCLADYGDCDSGQPGCETYLGIGSVGTEVCGRCRLATGAVGNPRFDGMRCSVVCPVGFASCDDDNMTTNGCETPTGTDEANCGSCHNECPSDGPHSTRACIDGLCSLGAIACDNGWLDCNPTAPGCETSVAETCDGTCASRCGAGETCTSGVCMCGAVMGTATTAACGTGEVCSMGQCVCGATHSATTRACRGVGAACCGSACVDLGTNTANCGRCGRACMRGCAGGECLP